MSGRVGGAHRRCSATARKAASTAADPAMSLRRGRGACVSLHGRHAAAKMEGIRLGFTLDRPRMWHELSVNRLV